MLFRSIHYTLKEREAKLSWKTDGKFKDTAVDVIGSSFVSTDPTDGTYSVRHVQSMLLPSTLQLTGVQNLLRSVIEKWQGRSLLLHPGDKHDLLTVDEDGKHQVTLSLVGQALDRNPE